MRAHNEALLAPSALRCIQALLYITLISYPVDAVVLQLHAFPPGMWRAYSIAAFVFWWRIDLSCMHAPAYACLLSHSALCCLQISADSYSFLFDLVASPHEVLQQVIAGLRELLEHDRVEKVVHDARAACAALLYQCGIHVKNIFDTQAGGMHVQTACL